MRSTTVLQPLPPLTSYVISHILLQIRSPSCKEHKQRNLWIDLGNSIRLIGWRDIWLAPTCKEEVLRFESQPPLLIFPFLDNLQCFLEGIVFKNSIFSAS